MQILPLSHSYTWIASFLASGLKKPSMMRCWRNLYRVPCRIVPVSCCSWKSGFEIYSSQVLQAPHWPIKRFLNFSSFLVLLQSESENFLQFNQRNNQQKENWIHLGRQNRWIRWIQWIQWIQITVLIYPLLNQTFIEIRAKIKSRIQGCRFKFGSKLVARIILFRQGVETIIFTDWSLRFP